MCIDNIQTNSLTSITSNKTFNFSILYTTIPHDKLKFKLASIVKQALLTTALSIVELAWRSGSVMDCHATARGLIPDGNGVNTELHVLRKGQ